MPSEFKMFFFKLVKFLLTDGKLDPNVKDEILQVFALIDIVLCFIGGALLSLKLSVAFK